MNVPLKVLLLEDDRLDAEMAIRLLKRTGMDIDYKWVSNRTDYLDALENFSPDVILADNELPRYSATEALEDFKRLDLSIPFIMVTGTVSEEFAVSMIKKGADDYILKDRPERLPNAIESAIKQHQAEKESRLVTEQLKASEEKYRTLVEQAFDGVLVYSATGQIVDANSSACLNTGYTLQELQAMHISDLLEAEGLADQPIDMNLVKDDKPVFHYRRLQAKDGSHIEVELVIRKLPGGEFMAVGRDITDRILAHRQIEFDHNNLQSLINNTRDLIWSMDKECRLITSNNSFNKWAEWLTGIKPFKGLSLYDPRLANINIKSFADYLSRAMKGEAFTVVEHFDLPDDTWAEISFYPIYEKEEVIGTACFSRNITAMRKSAEEIRLQNERFEMVTKATNDIIWDWDLLTDKFWWSDNYYTHFGYDRSSTPADFRSWDDRVHPEDKERVVSRMFSTVRKKEPFWTDEYRFLNGNGETAHVLDCGYTLFQEDGKPYRMVGAMMDITERIKAQEKLKAMEQERLQLKLQEQKKITRAMIRGQEKERNQLGRELHDNISQLLAAIKMKLAFSLSHPEKSNTFIQECLDNIQEAISETRNLSHRMVMPRFAESSLEDEMTNLLSIYHNIGRITNLKIEGVLENEIPALIKETLYRIAQEQLHNIEKYAQASEVHLQIRGFDGYISMRIEDNGVGFDTTRKRNGIGLTNVHNRAESYNGTALVLSEPGKGCQLLVEIPITPHVMEEVEVQANGKG